MPKVYTLKAPNGFYTVCSMDDDVIEREFPPMWLGAYVFFKLIHVDNIPEDDARKRAFEILKHWVDKPCPAFLIDLFWTNKKKEQERLLRGHSITSDDLICWILTSGRYGGLISQYIYNEGAGSLRGRAPIMVDANDPNHLVVIGDTDLSEAALMHLIENQRKIIAQFIDFKDGRWLCFYRTFKGLTGRESGNQGPHLHFISSAYGLDRSVVVDEIKKGNAPAGGFHVKFISHWDTEINGL